MSDTPARHIGTLSMIEAGSTQVWSSTRVDRYDHPVGGVVVSIDTTTDPETGAVERTYLCLDPFNTRPRLILHRIKEAEVTQQGVEPVDASRLVSLIRRMAEELYQPATTQPRGGKRRSPSFLSTHEARMVGWMQTMTAVLYGQVGLTPAGRSS